VRRRLRDEDFDVVLLNGSDLLWLLDELPASLPCVVVAQNIEHTLFDSQVRSMSSLPAPLWRLLNRDRDRLEKYELAGFQRAGNVIFLCAEDAAYAKRRCADLNMLIQPPVFLYPPPVREMTERVGDLLEIGFVANLGWWPNREGLDWFLKQVLPHVKDRVRLHLFGVRSEAAVDLASVKAHGFVADPARVWGSCHLMICPIFSGGGVAIKVAEAIYNRVPILASPFAMRGLLPIEEDPAVVVLDGAADWVRFLRSDEARALAGGRVSAALAGRFNARHHLSAIRGFFTDLIQQVDRNKY
jgi:hypothetical protein